jgi:hypothetical protein
MVGFSTSFVVCIVISPFHKPKQRRLRRRKRVGDVEGSGAEYKLFVCSFTGDQLDQAKMWKKKRVGFGAQIRGFYPSARCGGIVASAWRWRPAWEKG